MTLRTTGKPTVRPLVMGLLISACLPALPDLTGKQCDAEHACGEGYQCVEALCCAEPCSTMTDAGVTDAGTSDAGPARGESVIAFGDFPSSSQGPSQWQAIGNYAVAFHWDADGHLAGGSVGGAKDPAEQNKTFIMQESFNAWHFKPAGTWCASGWVKTDAGVQPRLGFSYCRSDGGDSCAPLPDGGAGFEGVTGPQVTSNGDWVNVKATARLPHPLNRFFIAFTATTLTPVLVDDIELFESFTGSCP